MLEPIEIGGISATALMATFELSRQQAAILHYMVWHEYADAESLAGLVGNLTVPMHRLKVRMQKFGISITTRRGLGYKLDGEMRDTVIYFVSQRDAARSYPQELPA